MKKSNHISINSILKLLEERQKWNEELVTIAKANLHKSPQGRMIISKSHNTLQYYFVDDAAYNNKRTYLKRSDKLIQQLASKKYNQEILKAATREKQWLDKFLKGMPERTIEDVFVDRPELRSLIVPYYMTDDEFIAYWNSRPYTPSPIDASNAIHLTENGELVRSKSEKIIADKLLKMNIPYKYECPLALGDKTLYPDFKILNVVKRKEMIHEHFGMMADASYAQRAINKINEYARSGILIGDRLIATFEAGDGAFDVRAYENMLKEYVLQ